MREKDCAYARTARVAQSCATPSIR